MREEKSCIPANPKGNSDVISREYLNSFCFEERLIGTSIDPDISTSFFGVSVSTPIMSGALSGLNGVRENGVLEAALAMKEMNSIFWLGVSPDEDVTTAAETGVHLIEIFKPYQDENLVYHKIDLDKKAGCIATGTDLDHCVSSSGGLDEDRYGNKLAPMSLETLKKYIAACEGLPFVVKGVLSVRDALLAAEAGASAIVLSHHHNIFPFAIPPLKVLPEIRKAVGKKLKIFADGQINDGYDAFKAMALGADGVLVGRALLSHLVKNGKEGVCEYLGTMGNQMKGMMARTCTPSIQKIDPAILRCL